MLKLLQDYAEKHDVMVEPGFAPKTVRWAIRFADNGRFIGVTELGDAEAKKNRGMEFLKCPDLTQPEMTAGGTTRSHFLVDAADVVVPFGSAADDAKKLAKHDYFVRLLRDASSVLPELAVLANALDDPETLEAIREQFAELKAKPTDKVTIGFKRPFPVEGEQWHDWWRSFREKLAAEMAEGKRETEAVLMRDFLTGEMVEPTPTHPKISGLANVGGSSMGSPLIGFDKEAFASYDLVQSANCAVSEEAAYAYRGGLNHLIAKHSHRFAGAKVVHWFKERVPDEDDPLPWLNDPAENDARQAQQKARELLTAIEQGERPDLAGNYYYAMTLSGAAGRVMVRDWMEGAFEDLVRNVDAWFKDLSIVHREGGERLAPMPKFYAVLGATVRALDDLTAPFVAKMWRVAVRNEPIPREALAQALQRVRVDIIEDVVPNHARMGLMKAYHVRKNREAGAENMPDNLKTHLNEEHPSAAYQCGRLMAVLAGLQRAALGDVGAGVVQRFYAAASSTPSLVLGRLTRTSQFHLNKIEGGGLTYWYENKLAEIWGRLGDEVPRTLDLEEQSLFALGYYQQLADLRTKKSDQSEDDTTDTSSEGDDSK